MKSSGPKTERVVLLDVHAIIHRAYHALPDFVSSKGEPTGALYGLTNLLLKIIKDMEPDHVIACYDLPGPTFRHESYTEYKAGRAKADDALIAQLNSSRRVFEAFHIPMYDAPGFEADDMLGTIVEMLKPRWKKGEIQVVIASGDMDTMQLISGKHVVVYTLKKGINDTIVYDEPAVKERFGFGPELLPDYKGLRGDPSDNIIGIAGIGEKTATELIVNFGGVEDIYKKLKKDPEAFAKAGIKPRIVELLKNGEDEAIFSKTLASIRRDAPIDFSLPKESWRAHFDPQAAAALAKEFEFRSLVSKIEALGNATPTTLSVPAPVVEEMATDGVMFKEAALMLWILDSSKTEPTPADIFDATGESSLERAHAALAERIAKEDPKKVYETIERPLIPLFDRAQAYGLLIDLEYLAKLSEEYHTVLSRIEKKIWEHAGEEFNINSPKQMGVILFEKLGLTVKGLKKTAGGERSTRVSELEKLVGAHPIVDEIMQYREYQKLLSTYIDVFPTLADENGRVHSVPIQTGSRTGRIASRDPALQNIPIKTDLGKNIRNAFIAPKGSVILSCDYSQIDLRCAALMTHDEKLTLAFKNGADIHETVAMEVFGVKKEDVTRDMRRVAKVLNFGILYGMGVNAIRQNTGTTREEAQQFYDNYFVQFARVQEYIDKTVFEAEKKGYTETFFGRRRYFPELKSKLPFIRASGVRQAINAPIQGTTADIIKIAMRVVDEKLKKAGLLEDAVLLLQVHDELLFEVKKDKVEEVAKLVKTAMEGAVDIGVPLVVKASVGRSWGEVAEI